jgi:hypothetical protein
LSLPSPPRVLPANPPVYELEPGNRLVRFYDPAYGPWDQQRAFGPLPGMRFDHHPPPLKLHLDRSIWYAATSLIGAVSEAFGDAGFIDPGSGRRICIASPRLSVRVLDLVGVAARVFGLDQRIGTDQESALCQEWARAFYDHYPELQGIRWRGRQAGSICIALNDRVEMDLLELVLDYDVVHPNIWPRIVDSARRAHLRLTSP